MCTRTALTLLSALAFVSCSGPEEVRDETSPETDETAPPEARENAEPTPSDETEAPDGPAWRAMAARAEGSVARLARADETLARLSDENRRNVVSVLDRMAAFGTGPEALRQAGALAEQSVSVAPTPEWDGSGTGPGATAVHAGAMAVLAGLVHASTTEDASSAQQLTDTLCGMPMPQYFNSGGRAPDREQRRSLVDEVNAALPEGSARASLGVCAE